MTAPPTTRMTAYPPITDNDALRQVRDLDWLREIARRWRDALLGQHALARHLWRIADCEQCSTAARLGDPRYACRRYHTWQRQYEQAGRALSGRGQAKTLGAMTPEQRSAAVRRVLEEVDAELARAATPATMTVTVRDRAAEAPWGSGPTNPVTRTVTISANCPRCGGRRGEPQGLNSCDDGAYYWVQTWTNPCGHVDMYADVIREAGELTRHLAAYAAAPTRQEVPS